MGKGYTVDKLTREIAVEEYITRFYRPDEVLGYCRACSNYGKQWGCPPFDFDVVERLSRFRTIRLIATKITFLDKSKSPCELSDLLRPERVRLEEELLALECEYNGLACTYIGECLHCSKGVCARLKGEPCCHPEKVRPSLEAYGFDIAKTMTELFGIELKWSANNALPEYLVLVCGVLHNGKVK